jgi:hypothetical protein
MEVEGDSADGDGDEASRVELGVEDTVQEGTAEVVPTGARCHVEAALG